MSDKCKLDTCEVVMQTRRGLCKSHYRALMKYGDPLHRSQTSKSMSLKEKLEFHGWDENLETGCWDWKGNTRRGYGRLSHKGKGVVATRAMVEVVQGFKVPSGRLVLHSCDRPICVNPKHLRVGTVKENTQDMFDRGRDNIARGERSGTSKLSENQVKEIMSRRKSGETGRSLAKEFGVSPALISHIHTGQRWKHLKEEE